MSILSISPTDTRIFSAEIAAALGDINAAVIVQQLNYWMNKDGAGTVINGIKYVYNTFVEWVNQQFPWLSVWQFRKAMSLLRRLGIVRVIRHKAKQWNQTNFYTLDSDRLVKFLNKETATTTEISELRHSAPQLDKIQTLEVRDTKVSLYESKNTSKKEQQSRKSTFSSKLKICAASSFSEVKKTKPDSSKPCTLANSSASVDRKKENVSTTKQDINKDKSSARVEQIINKDWKTQIQDLDDAGIRVNQTLINLIKTYLKEEVESAIALVKAKKREQHIPNPAGYFTKALKENWAGETVVNNESNTDTASVFRYWYDLAKELGYVKGQETREGEQWVCLSGSWEKWKNAVERGYSMNYLKKIMKRSPGR